MELQYICVDQRKSVSYYLVKIYAICGLSMLVPLNPFVFAQGSSEGSTDLSLPAGSTSSLAVESSQNKGGRNPFLSPIEELLVEEAPALEITDAGSEDLTLSGILRTEDRSTAIINNVILREGETIAGFQLASVERKSVVLMKDGERYILRMEEMTEEEEGEEP